MFLLISLMDLESSVNTEKGGEVHYRSREITIRDLTVTFPGRNTKNFGSPIKNVSEVSFFLISGSHICMHNHFIYLNTESALG